MDPSSVIFSIVFLEKNKGTIHLVKSGYLLSGMDSILM